MWNIPFIPFFPKKKNHLIPFLDNISTFSWNVREMDPFNEKCIWNLRLCLFSFVGVVVCSLSSVDFDNFLLNQCTRFRYCISFYDLHYQISIRNLHLCLLSFVRVVFCCANFGNFLLYHWMLALDTQFLSLILVLLFNFCCVCKFLRKMWVFLFHLCVFFSWDWTCVDTLTIWCWICDGVYCCVI